MRKLIREMLNGAIKLPKTRFIGKENYKCIKYVKKKPIIKVKVKDYLSELEAALIYWSNRKKNYKIKC